MVLLRRAAAATAAAAARAGRAGARVAAGRARGLATANAAVDGSSRTNPQQLIVTCEHAGEDLPAGWEWGPRDLERGLPSQHWAYDPGAADFARELARELDAPAVLSRFSRLFVDVNRPVASPTLARGLCDGEPVQLNAGLGQDELARRVMDFYLPYHREVESVACSSGARTAVSVHTYTANYEGALRPFEIGVLYSTTNRGLAEALTARLVEQGFSARLNEPWSGKDGFMFSADNFVYNSAPTPGRRDAVMFEFRNDVCVDPAWRASVLACIAPLLKDRPRSL